jgi:acyl-CoA hydrolase
MTRQAPVIAIDSEKTYHRKCRTMREAIDLVGSDDTVAAPIAGGQPAAFLTALAERDDWRSLTLFSGLLIAPYPVLTHPNVRLISGFYGPIERMLRSMGGRVDYLPADFIGWERYATIARPRVVVSALAPMDEHGYLNFGVHAGATFNAFLEAARDPERLAIGEIVRDMPHVYGLGRHGGNRIHV